MIKVIPVQQVNWYSQNVQKETKKQQKSSEEDFDIYLNREMEKLCKIKK